MIQIENLNQSLKGQGHIQKIQSTPTTFCFRVRIPGESVFIHFGRGHGVEGVWFDGAGPESKIRIKDKFDDWLRKSLIGARIARFECDSEQRIVSIEYFKDGSLGKISFYYKGRRLYFCDYHNQKSFSSWIGVFEEWGEKELPSPKVMFGSLYSGPIQSKEEKEIPPIGNHYSSLVEVKENKREKKKNEKKIQKLKEEISLVNCVPQAQAEMGLVNENEKEVQKVLEAFKINKKKKREESFFQYRDRMFQKLKNLKKSREFLQEKLAKLEIQHKKGYSQEFLKKTIMPEWKTPSRRKNKNIFYFEINGIKGGIGRNTSGNDQLRNSFANKDDIWFHLEGDKSPHVILKTSIENINEELAGLVGSLIRDQMNQKLQEMRLIYTKVKNLRGLPGKSGAVTIKNPSYFKVLYNENWTEIIALD